MSDLLGELRCSPHGADGRLRQSSNEPSDLAATKARLEAPKVAGNPTAPMVPGWIPVNHWTQTGYIRNLSGFNKRFWLIS